MLSFYWDGGCGIVEVGCFPCSEFLLKLLKSSIPAVSMNQFFDVHVSLGELENLSHVVDFMVDNVFGNGLVLLPVQEFSNLSHLATVLHNSVNVARSGLNVHLTNIVD